jgi:nitroimidazol reductase NimA-like FMN-containing flavoprotein (pyridoxamine 5'-phosphate oxidase superfamily)
MREPRSLVDVRRKDREVEDQAFIRALLHHAPMGVLATARDGQPFVNSNLFVYDEPAHVIYMHTAHVGRTADNVEREQHVCFTVSEMGRLLPAERAFSMSVEYRAVVVFGRARVIDDEASKRHALDLLVRKYFPHLTPGDDYALPDADELKLTAAYRIEIDAWSGKQKQADANHPGAFHYGDHSAA